MELCMHKTYISTYVSLYLAQENEVYSYVKHVYRIPIHLQWSRILLMCSTCVF